MPSISNAMEGDFIETVDGLIFDVKGFIHPNDRIIAYLRYMPLNFLIEKIENSFLRQNLKLLSNSFDMKNISSFIEEKICVKVNDVRLRNSIDINIKLYDLHARHQILSKYAKEYIFKHPNYDFALQAVPIGKIVKHYCPERFLINYLHDGKIKDKEDTGIKSFIAYLIAKLNLTSEDVGISGSKMVNLEKKGESDLDIIIYGDKQSKKVHEFIKEILNRVNNDSLEINDLKFDVYRNSEEHLKKLYSIRDSNQNVSFEEFCKLENRKFHQFLLNESDVFIRFLKYKRENNPFQGNFENLKYETIGRVQIKGEVVEDKDSIFTPVSYFIRVGDICMLSGTVKNSEIPDLNINKSRLEVFSMRGKYTEHVNKGETVLVQGKLEKTEEISQKSSEKKHSFRLIIGEKNDFFRRMYN